MSQSLATVFSCNKIGTDFVMLTECGIRQYVNFASNVTCCRSFDLWLISLFVLSAFIGLCKSLCAKIMETVLFPFHQSNIYYVHVLYVVIIAGILFRSIHLL